MKRGKIIAVLTAGVLTVSAIGGTALAHWGPGNQEAVYEKIADELGTDQEAVSDAFSTAKVEARDVAVAERLSKLVEDGALTQDEADSIQAWLDSAPEAASRLPFPGGRGAHADLERVAEILGVDVETLAGVADAARDAVALDAYQTKLDEAVANGRITQDQADEMLQRFENRPAKGFDGERGFGHGRMHRAHGPGGEHGGRGFGPMPFGAPESNGGSVADPAGTAA